MTLPELSIKRHVLAWMLSGVLVLFGIISYQRIGMDRLPYIEFPVVSISTALRGANPDIVDASITNLLETSVNSVPGIDGDCGGQCACATCHVFIEAPWAALTGPRTEREDEMLNFAAELRDSSRLACQIELSDALDGIVVGMPEGQH